MARKGWETQIHIPLFLNNQKLGPIAQLSYLDLIKLWNIPYGLCSRRNKDTLLLTKNFILQSKFICMGVVKFSIATQRELTESMMSNDSFPVHPARTDLPTALEKQSCFCRFYSSTTFMLKLLREQWPVFSSPRHSRFSNTVKSSTGLLKKAWLLQPHTTFHVKVITWRHAVDKHALPLNLLLVSSGD